jgi:hypothetical protein
MMHLNITTIQRANVGKLMYFTDVFRTMLHWRWYWIALVVTMMYMIQFTIFAAIYYLLGSYRVINTANDDCSNRQCDCMPDITTFEEAFFFSVQTQITIGYGDMVPNPRCSLAILFIIIQSLVGLTADAMLFGLVYQRYVLALSLALSLSLSRHLPDRVLCSFSRPQKNAPHICFSDVATIGTRDGKQYFMFRLANMRSTQILNPKISVFTTSFRVTMVRLALAHTCMRSRSLC